MNKSLYKPVKELGQNFLTDHASINKMIQGLELQPNDTVIEIGPGLGVLTQQLANKLITLESHIYAIEIDNRFVDKLITMFLEKDNLDVIEANVLDWLPTFVSEKPFKIIGSLPYYITSPIVHKIIHMERQPELCILLVQKEVAERIYNKEPDATYLSVFVQTFYDVNYLGTIDREKFSPAPSVHGGILQLKKRETLIEKDEIRAYSGFLHKGFSNPRKMLNKVFANEVLEKFNLDPTLRPQNINVDTWVELFKATQQ